jgi:hypothetical protein
LSSRSSNVKSSEIENQITSADPKVVNACLDYAKDLLSSEQERSQTIANKSTNVLGFAGIIAALSPELMKLVSSVAHENYYMSLILSVMFAAMLI